MFSRRARIDALDLWRSICVWMMLAYHLLWDLSALGHVPAALLEGPTARCYAFLGAAGFILLSGLCTRLSRNPLRRGAVVLCAAAAVTVTSTLAGAAVRFGVLHLLGCCMLLYGLLGRRLEAAMERPAFPLACLALFAASGLVCGRAAVGPGWLYPLGLRSADFVSADYYPLLPWGFLFLCGAWTARHLDATGLQPLLRRRFPAALTFWGRHSLMIYLLHQPLFWAVLLAAERWGPV